MFRSGVFLFLGLLLGRILGLAREFALVNHLGSGELADSIIALITLPDIAISILLGNSLAVVFIPKILSLQHEKRFGYFLKMSVVLGVISITLIGFCVLNITTVATLILPSGSQLGSFLPNLKWILLAIPILALNSVSRTFLQAENRFFLLGFENVIFNLVLILGITLFAQNKNLYIISLAVVSGTILRWLLQTYQLARIYKITNDGFEQSISTTDFKRYNLAFCTGLLTQLLPVFGRSISSAYDQEGALAIFNYAFKFTEFPMALGISVISTMLFPKLTGIIANAKKDSNEFIQKCHKFILAFGIPLSIMTPFLLLFLSRYDAPFHLDKESFEKILLCIGLGLGFFIFRGLNEFYVVVLNSLGDVRRPMISTTISSSVSLLLIFILTKHWGIVGAFWGLNGGYILTLFLNGMFLTSKYDINLLNDAISREILIQISLSAMASFLFLAIQPFLNLGLGVVLWTCLILLTYLPSAKYFWKFRRSN